MNVSLYDASIPTMIRMLQNLRQILQKGAAFAGQKGMSPAALLDRSLHPDMFPLSRQVEIVVSGVKGSAARLAGRLDPKEERPEFAVFNRGDEPSFGDRLTSFDELQAQIEDAIAYLKTLSCQEIEAAPATITVAKRGEARIFETRSFLLDYVLPNLYFHITVVYSLLRSAGVDVGKKDFEGTPAYRVQRQA
ncbi:DUF1993 domain-containing protein [Polyangium mundeleinium]|uniref:DUF1993 domain-containing protein n=1 Tax=Polyangium mundeleinium TaxID=2995306 RepID=A0ABT5F774_9BACT|nr:DUF1993 domain-containing protein [Polyangium mundeleinium]MDC0748977.1 DUF1993 domain-containing protein [Polyangium mundeleinium]